MGPSNYPNSERSATSLTAANVEVAFGFRCVEELVAANASGVLSNAGELTTSVTVPVLAVKCASPG